MEVVFRMCRFARSLSVGFLLTVFLVVATFAAAQLHVFTDFFGDVEAATGVIDPNANGTVSGTLTTCGTGGNYDCLNDAVRDPTAPSTSGDYVTIANNAQSYYQMNSITNVSSVSAVSVKVYHRELNANMATYVSLWDATETTQYGATVQLTNRGTAQWDTANITGLSLTQAQLDGLRVRLRCQRPAGGGTNSCVEYAMYADVTYTEVINVTVSSTGSQQNLDKGATNAHVGGAFVISEDTSSRNITSIKITETGTVDAAADLDNIKLTYATSTNCTTRSYTGTEAQFGSTDTDGFDGSNTSTFTGSVAVTTAYDMCVYAVLDIASGATAGETIELEITNPTTDVGASGSPIISPATVIALSGSTVIQEVVLTQTHYHWRNDDNVEASATSATGGTEDTVFNDFPRGVNYRLRLQVSNEGNKTSAATTYRLEYAPKVSTCSAATGWTDVGAGSGDWDMSASPHIADGNTTNIAESIGGVTNENTTFVGTGGLRETTSSSGSITLTSTEYAELEYAIVATANATDGQTYCFRVTSSGTALQAYNAYPEATIASDLLVTATSTQIANVSIPTTGQDLGAGFVITDSSIGSHTVSSVTLHASGTVDKQADIDNIILWYEYDTVAPYDCTGKLFNGDETQYGSTDSDGFNGSNQSTFTDSMSVSPTQGICLYVEYDVLATASDGETFDVYLSNAATDIVINTGTIAPASSVPLPGMTTFTKANVVQSAYHWRNNDGTESAATSATGGSQNTAWLEYPDSTVTRLRFGVANTGGQSATNYQYRLEWGQKVTSCSAVSTWTDVATGGDDWSIVASQLVDGSNTTNIATGIGGITDVGTFAAVAGQEETSSQTGNITIGSGNFAELEYSLQAASTIPEGARYCFRLTNAGTVLDSYTNYAEATIKLATDFAVTRNVANIGSGATTVTITEGVDYDLQFNDASRAYIRITNAHHTGGGPNAGATGNHTANNVTAYISNPSNIATSITFTRAGTTNDTDIAWEVVEYIGDTAGENEFVVRSAAVGTYVAANTTLTTGAVSGIVSDADVAVFITGQGNPDGGRADYNSGLSTAAWNSGADTITFTRGESGSDAVNVSYAVVEFTGANWKVQRSEHTYSAVGVTQTENITSVNSLSRTFVHAQHRAGAGLDTHADFGHEVWLSSIGVASYRLNGAAGTASGHVSVAWIIENTQATGKRMVVNRYNNTLAAGGGGLTSTNVNLSSTLTDLSVASIFANNSADGGTNSFPEPMMSARIISTTQFNLRVSDDADNMLYRVEVVEWPTASRKLVQDDFRVYEDNDALTPTVARGGLGENAEMTASSDPIAPAESVRIRMNLQVTAAAMPAGVDAFSLQYAKRPPATACSALSTWYYLGDTASTTAAWRAQAGTPSDGTTLSSLLLSASTIAGTYEEENLTALVPNQALVNERVEYDWNVEHNGADDKSDYCFRMVESDGSPLFSYNTYPVLRTVGYGPVVSQWRFYDDETSLTPTVSLAGENVAPSGIDNDDVIKLRVSVAETTGAPGNNVKFKLQFSEDPAFATFTDVIATSTCLENSLWCYADGAGVNNAIMGTTLMSDTDACPTGCGTYNEASSTAGTTFDHATYSTSEFEFTLQHAGARVNAVYYFRLWNVNDNELVPASTTYPSLLAASSTLSATSTGVIAGTTVDGHTSDVTTTATSVSFGDVVANDAVVAIQRLALGTNATEGYQVLVFTDQLLTNGYGSTIPLVTGTNAAPLSWAAGCPTLQTGCFGYHTSDDVLEGPSVRFAADDTFAGLTTAPEEIIYSGVPGTEDHDIVYKLLVRELQESGDYTANLTYIISPVY
jgi:hypothetical protein